MADFEMRPRFAVEVACGAEAVVRALREGIAHADPPLEGHCDPEHCVLRVPAERRYFWSPELDLTFEPLADEGGAPREGVRVRCLFGPRPPVWTGFVFVYAMLGLVGLSGGMLGLAQLAAGAAPWGLAVPVASGTLAGFVYGATFVGQGLAATQMYEMRTVLDACLGEAEARALARPRTPLDSARL